MSSISDVSSRIESFTLAFVRRGFYNSTKIILDRSAPAFTLAFVRRGFYNVVPGVIQDLQGVFHSSLCSAWVLHSGTTACYLKVEYFLSSLCSAWVLQ